MAIDTRARRPRANGRTRLTVIDTVDGAAPVDVSMTWQLGPDVHVELNGAHAALSWPVGPESRSLHP